MATQPCQGPEALQPAQKVLVFLAFQGSKETQPNNASEVLPSPLRTSSWKRNMMCNFVHQLDTMSSGQVGYVQREPF